MNSADMPNNLGQIKRLPALPHDAHLLVKALSDEHIDYGKLTKVLAGHPTISSRLIALANSAWYNNSGEPVTSLERCCLKLGLNVVRGVGIGLAVMKPFNVRSCPEFDIRRYWASTMLTAQAAAALSECLREKADNRQFAQTAHTAGILHNIGLLCLADIMPDATRKALREKIAKPDIALNDALRQVMSTDYCEVGASLTGQWGIPEALVTAIRFHRDSHYRGHYWQQALVVGGAVEMVGYLFENQESIYPQQLQELNIDPERQLEIFNALREQYPKTLELAKLLFH